MNVGFQPVDFVLWDKVVKLLCMGRLSPICSLVLFLAFKCVVHCVLFLSEKVHSM